MLWIRIRIDLAVLDPDPYWECGSGSRSMDIDKDLPIHLVSFLSKRLLYLRRQVFGTIDYFKCIFHVRFQLFVTLKSDYDPVPH